MQVEADIYLIFTGWNASTTQDMSLNELMQWHTVAIERYNKAKEENEAGGT